MAYRKIFSIFLILLFVAGSGCIIGNDGDIVDSDGDGVQDKYDACPSIAGDPSNQGCPKSDTPQPTPTESPPADEIADSDGDGVQDKYDACPEIAGDPSNQGCPLQQTEPPETYRDTDGDGVQDTYDACPEIAGDPSNQGCPSGDDGSDNEVAPFWTFTPMPSMTISPTLLYYKWLGEWWSDGSQLGIEKLWIVLNEDGDLDVHCFANVIFSIFYIGHFYPTMEDGKLVGELVFEDHDETITLSIVGGTITSTRVSDYDGTTYEQVSELTKTDSVTLSDANYIESYGGSWFKIGETGRVRSLYIEQVWPNMLEVSIWGNCIPDPCDWGTHAVYFDPSKPIEFDFQDGNYTRTFEIFLGSNGELQVYWEFEHSGGGISAGFEEFFRLVFI